MCMITVVTTLPISLVSPELDASWQLSEHELMAPISVFSNTLGCDIMCKSSQYRK